MPTTGKHNLITFGSLYITRDGLVSGKPCKTELTGFDVFEFAEEGSDARALSGLVYQQYQDIVDAPVSIAIVQTTISVKDDFVDEIDVWRASPGTPINLVLANGPKELTLDFKPRAKKPVEYPGTFSNTQMYNVTIHGYATLS